MPTDGRPRIAVVNDNPDFLELMSAILDDDAGYDVTLYNAQQATIAELAASDPHLVIVDLLLGGASGWELVTLARADDRLSSVPIIVCSADVKALREREAELEGIGAVHVIEKPFTIEEMTGMVETLVGRAAPASG
jgi:DNA-binding response OmpR family regulator